MVMNRKWFWCETGQGRLRVSPSSLPVFSESLTYVYDPRADARNKAVVVLPDGRRLCSLSLMDFALAYAVRRADSRFMTGVGVVVLSSVHMLRAGFFRVPLDEGRSDCRPQLTYRVDDYLMSKPLVFDGELAAGFTGEALGVETTGFTSSGKAVSVKVRGGAGKLIVDAVNMPDSETARSFALYRDERGYGLAELTLVEESGGYVLEVAELASGLKLPFEPTKLVAWPRYRSEVLEGAHLWIVRGSRYAFTTDIGEGVRHVVGASVANGALECLCEVEVGDGMTLLSHNGCLMRIAVGRGEEALVKFEPPDEGVELGKRGYE